MRKFFRKNRPLFKKPVTYQWPLITRDMEKAVIKQMNTALSIYKRAGVVAEFEDMFAKIHRAKYSLVTSSGTSALHSAFYAIGLGPGDEVICPDNTFFATAMPLFQLGALPVLADCDQHGGLDPEEIVRLVNKKTKAVVVTHMWGNPCQMDRIVSYCKKYRLKLVEDCSHAHGAMYKGKYVGTIGDIGAWSLQTQKIIASGEGGILVTNNQEYYDRAQLLGHFNKRSMDEISKNKPYYKYASTGTGLKYRAHPLGVALALTQLPHLATWMKGKRYNAKRLSAIIKRWPGMVVVDPPRGAHGAYYALTFLVDKKKCGISRDELVSKIQAEGFLDIDIPKATSPLHTFAAFQKPISPVIRYAVSSVRGTYPNTRYIAEHIVKISVPVEMSRGSRGDKFVKAFDKVWLKVYSAYGNK